MNYRKLDKNAIPTQLDNHLHVFSFLGGLAAGAVVALLFAPRAGRESIKLLLEKFNLTEQNNYNELEEQLLEEVRKTSSRYISRLPRQSKLKYPDSSSITRAMQDHGKRSQQIGEDRLLL